MSEETKNNETKTERKRREQEYLVLELVECIDPDVYAKKIDDVVSKGELTIASLREASLLSRVQTWIPVVFEPDENELPTTFENLSDCDKWIRDHGEDGATYRPARVAKPVRVRTVERVERIVE